MAVLLVVAVLVGVGGCVACWTCLAEQHENTKKNRRCCSRGYEGQLYSVTVKKINNNIGIHAHTLLHSQLQFQCCSYCPRTVIWFFRTFSFVYIFCLSSSSAAAAIYCALLVVIVVIVLWLYWLLVVDRNFQQKRRTINSRIELWLQCRQQHTWLRLCACAPQRMQRLWQCLWYGRRRLCGLMRLNVFWFAVYWRYCCCPFDGVSCWFCCCNRSCVALTSCRADCARGGVRCCACCSYNRFVQCLLTLLLL